MENVVRCLAKALVQQPDKVQVEEFDEGDCLVVELEVAQSDLGRVIGRQGKTADAMRTIVEAVARHRNERWELEILD
jgi:predicted RNA-binding protein YlqC (UPF0109 family)